MEQSVISQEAQSKRRGRGEKALPTPFYSGAGNLAQAPSWKWAGTAKWEPPSETLQSLHHPKQPTGCWAPHHEIQCEPLKLPGLAEVGWALAM